MPGAACSRCHGPPVARAAANTGRAWRRGSRGRPGPWSASHAASAAYATSIQLRCARAGKPGALREQERAERDGHPEVEQRVEREKRARGPTCQTHPSEHERCVRTGVAVPPAAQPVKPTASTARNPASADGQARRPLVHAERQRRRPAPSQYCSGGFSKYLRSFRRGVTQSPLTAISRAISA